MKLSASGKTAVRRTKSTANGAKSIQAKVALNKTTYNPLITPAVLKAVSKTVTAIDRALVVERRFSVNLGGLLAKLKSEISTHLESTGNKSPYQAKVAFNNLVQTRFKIGESRAAEYIRLSDRKDLHRLGLPTSLLIELSRLDDMSLKRFMKKHPTAELKKLPFKEIKKLVRDNNSKKRETGTTESSSGEQVVNIKAIAEKLRTNFEKVRSEFDDNPNIDRNLDAVLGEISKWYLDKKVA